LLSAIDIEAYSGATPGGPLLVDGDPLLRPIGQIREKEAIDSQSLTQFDRKELVDFS
jgi:hypothetical protein